jgi:hypothetical protein
VSVYIDPGEDVGVRHRTSRKLVVAPQGPSLFDAPAPSVPRPTSEDASDQQTRGKRAIDRLTVLRTVAWHHDGLTRDQIAEETGISPNTVRPRIVELITLGHIADRRLTRLTVTGSPAAVCEVTDAGRNWLKEQP